MDGAFTPYGNVKSERSRTLLKSWQGFSMTDVLKSIELFTGGGGLALGLEQSGFRHELLLEINQNANDTIKYNIKNGNQKFSHWKILEDNIFDVNFQDLEGSIDLVAGGPPCQPFSLGGKHKGYKDKRDLFPQAVRVVKQVKPRAFIFENVRGLLRPSFSSYFEYVILQLKYPTVTRRSSENNEDHLARLEKIESSGISSDVSYNVVFRCLNAADFGVPQKRERVFIVGFRSDLGFEWSFPKKTHGDDELIWAKWVTGDYWNDLRIDEKKPQKKDIDRIKSLERTGFSPVFQRWKTIRETIGDLPSPQRDTLVNFDITNHEYRSGARVYKGHTGSNMDDPSKTLKAGNHGVPGGENMIRLDDDSYRYFTVRESARVQTFPDDFHFCGSWTEAMRQIGNAVPPELARIVGKSVAEQLMG